MRSGGRTTPRLPNSASRLVRSPANLRAGLFLLLLALLVQGAAVQTHLHFVQQVRSLAAGSSDRQLHLSRPDANDPAAHCALCQEAAMAGAYVLPPAAHLPPVPAPVLWIAVAAIAAFGLLAPALGWQSRAPPQ